MDIIWKNITIIWTLLSILSGNSPLHERYHTYEEIQEQLEEWNTEFGNNQNPSSAYPESGIIYHLEELGASTEDGLPFWAVKLSYNANLDEDEPKILFLGQCHAEEILGVEITMEMINKFLNPTPQYHLQNMQAILQSSEVWVVPTYNPEGLTVVHGDSVDGNWLQDISYRKNKRDVNLNGIFDFDNTAEAGNDSDGVDLNRNYNFNWIFGDGAWVEDYGNYQSHFDYYRGESPFSESETQAIRDFAIENKFLLSIAYHSSRSGNVSEQIIFPWMWNGGKSSPDYPVISSLAMGISNLIPTETGVEFANYITVAGVSRKGNAHDWFYTETGCIQFLIEVGTSNLQPDSLEIIEDTINRNLQGAIHLMNRGIGYTTGNFGADAFQVSGIVLDASNNTPIEGAIVKILEYDGPMLKPRTTDQFGRYRRLLTQGTFTLHISASGFEAQSFTIVPSSSSQTEQNVSLIPLDIYTLELTINPPVEYTDDIILLLTDQYSTDTLEVNGTDFSIQISENQYTIKILGEDLFPYSNEIDLSMDSTIMIELSWETEFYTESFDNIDEWFIEDGEWYIENGKLKSQTGLTYPSNTISFISSTIINPGYQLLALSLQFQYEMEWGNDTAFVSFLGDQDTVSFFWVDQYWENHTELLPFEINSESFRIQIGIKPDNTLEYRGIKIDKLKLIYPSENNPMTINNNGNNIPKQILLYQNYPNPFNPITSITFELPEDSDVQLSIYNLTGKKVLTLIHEIKEAGRHTIQLNGNNLSSGIYFYALDTPSNKLVKKLVLIK